LLLIVVSALPGRADAADTKTQDGKSQPAAIKNAPATVTVKMLEVTNARPKNKDRAGIGDHIIVKVDSLKSLLTFAGNNLDKIRLTIDGEKINTPAPVRTGDENSLRYTITKDAANKKVLDSLFVNPLQMVATAQVSLSVDEPVKKVQQDIWPGSFRLVRPTNFNGMLFCIALVLFALSFMKLGKFDARLRNYDSDSTFSLSLVQMAVWYYVVTMSFLYLYFSGGFCMPELNQSTMVLLGISSATALGGKIINVSNTEKEKTESAEKSRQDRSVAGNDGAATGATKGAQSNGLLLDILSDEYGINLTRFQIFVWTLVMVGIFIWTVISESVIPDFSDSNLLLLMGISSGSYLGYKLKEAPPQQPEKSSK